jgi:dihydroorotate dehydrogenase
VDIYRFLKPLLFRLPAESAHNAALLALRLSPAAWLRRVGVSARLPRRQWGIEFPNPVGLAAGMDKNASALLAWEALGFGFVEVGTITALPQPGNPKPRCFRYPSRSALVNRMGFNNAGASAIASRIARQKAAGRWPKIPVGINLGKSKATPNEQAASDYATSFRLLLPFGDYFVVNVSSPNTPNLRALQDRDALAAIVSALQKINPGKPLLVKIAPDLAPEAVREIASLAEAEGLAGLIATNTTLDHSSLPAEADQPGGLSGAPLTKKSDEILEILRSSTRLPLIGSGGVMSAEDAVSKIARGADLIQIYTGFVYHGPRLIGEICEACG